MMIVGPHGGIYRVPDPKAEPTQELLGDVYDKLDEALDFMECVYQATLGPDHRYKDTSPLRAVLDIAKQRVAAAKDTLHDTIAWAE